jgi:manganese oxidase
MRSTPRLRLIAGSVFLCSLIILTVSPDAAAQTCGRTITAEVVALDQPFFWNRLGAVQPQGMIYALRRDVIPINPELGLVPGNVQLRADKRPRPVVLRMNAGDCLQVKFQNLLAASPVDNEQPATRTASIHVIGLQLVGGIGSDGSNVGRNASSLVAPGGSAVYTYFAEKEGTHLMYSGAAQTGGEGDGGSVPAGLFGSVNVQVAGAEWYRSQVTAADLKLATKRDEKGNEVKTPAGQPVIDYDAVYPAGHKFAGLPILKMARGNEIVHTDINAVITGPNKGRFPKGTFRSNPTEPDREQPYREFTVIYHDEIGAVQAFPEFEDPVLGYTLHSVRDGFAINYGTAGAGAEILANRFGVGPMANCTECKYEDFFLSSWSVGDPAQVVDVPANTRDATNKLIRGKKATKALYPDDPSNVHHSYLRDHVKFRVLHAGPKEHHIHHQHAHQWVHTPDSDNSSYLDSQAIGPGSGFTLEMTYQGSGNRNLTPGDSIYHCHFYPHFAQGMWALWRVHDVLETGTVLDSNGRPAKGSRALPDGEIAAGTPIPAVVPLPTLAMAPPPGASVSINNGQPTVSGTGNPGYPFFVPGVAGHRPPKPPLDTVDDGGLPRHVITGGTFVETHTRLDFSKRLVTAAATALPEAGTPTEIAAMNFHAQRSLPSFTPSGTPASFVTNGRPPVAGAPFADPCVDDAGNAVGAPRTYKGANIQLDLKLNKAGWHFPQSRILALWDDVKPTLSGARAPEPLFFRANTNDCISFFHTNLVPGVYEQDDFQVRTPTDLMGQHIHLVKFDVLASDGAGNGWNYEDGTFSPDEVVERINAINAAGGLLQQSGKTKQFTKLAARPHPFFGTPGAQTTVQRWFADNVLNNAGQDRTLRTVFTHDHYGPSTHQQVGTYAGLVIEPQGSKWRDPETGTFFGTRADGGPTSWRADILTANAADSYREFLLEYTDFQLAYTADNKPVNPPGRVEVGLPFLLAPPKQCPGGVPAPCPEAISADDPGTMSVNYRNEPVALRVRDPLTNAQAAGDAGDLSFAFSSKVVRRDAALNSQPKFYPPLTGGVQPGDPFTPLLRVYDNDRVQIRVLVGGQEEGHNLSLHGLKWLSEPSDLNSGWRNSQMTGISEHFEFNTPVVAPKNQRGPFADYLYQVGSSVDDLWNGSWGLLRSYKEAQPNLLALPSSVAGGPDMANPGSFRGVCPITAPARSYDISAVSAQQALPGGTLVYNSRTSQGGQLHDPTAILYVRTADLDPTTLRLKPGVPIEPLILRANAGDCVSVTLRNRLKTPLADLAGFNTLPMIVNNFNANQVRPSPLVGLHPQLLAYDVTRGDGANVGFNNEQTVRPASATTGTSQTYTWYAGDLALDARNNLIATPVEFGATNLISSDRIKHSNKGAVAALIVEPPGATWVEDAGTRAAATVTTPAGSFREFVLVFQNDLNLRFGGGAAVPNLAESEDPEDSGQKAFNYRTEPLWKRLGFAPDTVLGTTRTFDFTNALSNSQVGGDPLTPVFTARAGTPVRFRLLHPQGHQRNNVFQAHGHIWGQLPYVNNSRALGSNPLSEWKGTQMGVGPSSHFDVLLKNGAGGRFLIPGDYLYRTQQSFQFDGGLWGIFRVTP